MSEQQARSFLFKEQLKIGNKTYYLGLTMLEKMHLEQELSISAPSLIGLCFENLQGVTARNLTVLFKYLITTKNYKPTIEDAASVLDFGLQELGLEKVIEAISVGVLSSFYTKDEVIEEKKQFRIRMQAIKDANATAKEIHKQAQEDMNKKKEARKKSGQKQS